eukprot:6738396-Prymnesium_polylepis.2
MPRAPAVERAHARRVLQHSEERREQPAEQVSLGGAHERQHKLRAVEELHLSTRKAPRHAVGVCESQPGSVPRRCAPAVREGGRSDHSLSHTAGTLSHTWPKRPLPPPTQPAEARRLGRARSPRSARRRAPRRPGRFGRRPRQAQ